MTERRLKFVQEHTQTHRIHDLEGVLMKAAVVAGEYIKDRAFDGYGTIFKQDGSPVTDVDKGAEHIIRDILKPEFACCGEEFGYAQDTTGLTAYIDPIDGTKDFIGKRFNTSVSIGIARGEKLVGGAVYDFMRDILYIGTEQTPTRMYHRLKAYPFKNGGPKRDIRKDFRVYIDGNDDAIDAVRDAVNNHYGAKDIQKYGSIALTFAQAAAGDADIIAVPYKKAGLHDISAGIYLLQNAGFDMYNFEGRRFKWNAPPTGLIGFASHIGKDEQISFMRSLDKQIATDKQVGKGRLPYESIAAGYEAARSLEQ
ncbi:MAG TPA: inositol monophosphatase family protein [Acidobacteriota bacterium]|nr:inositol monophosphatase family protein [Acidobacteriota bacterium]